MTSEPLVFSFDVACSKAHAFETWTAQIGRWWPADHTLSGDDVRDIVMETGVGGRIYERSAAGEEHDWGVVTIWEPPSRLGYLWHLGGSPAQATDVEIRFVTTEPSQTRVEIEHRGWERLGGLAAPWRARNQKGWETLLPHFVTATEEGD